MKGRLRAFTLIELVVSMAIVSLLCLLLFSTIDASSNAWTQSDRKLDAFREARAALHIITRDLQAALKLPQNDCFFALQDRGGHGHISVTGGKPATAGHGDCLFFLCAQPSGISGGDLAIVGYYLSYWEDTGETSGSFKLHRFYRNSSETTALLSDRLKGVLVTFANAEGDQDQDEVLARNVIDFDVIPYRRENGGALTAPTSGWPASEIPAMVEISLSAYDSRSAVRVGTYEDWLKTESPFARQHLRRFSTKVALESSQ